MVQRGTSDFRYRSDVCLALRCGNHGEISSSASGNRHFYGVRGARWRVEPRARNGWQKKRDLTGDGAGRTFYRSITAEREREIEVLA